MSEKRQTGTSSAGLSDGIRVEVNGEVVGVKDPRPPVPGKPTSRAKKPIWGEYLVALGMSPETDFESYSYEELAELAARFGG